MAEKKDIHDDIYDTIEGGPSLLLALHGAQNRYRDKQRRLKIAQQEQELLRRAKRSVFNDPESFYKGWPGKIMRDSKSKHLKEKSDSKRAMNEDMNSGSEPDDAKGQDSKDSKGDKGEENFEKYNEEQKTTQEHTKTTLGEQIDAEEAASMYAQNQEYADFDAEQNKRSEEDAAAGNQGYDCFDPNVIGKGLEIQDWDHVELVPFKKNFYKELPKDQQRPEDEIREYYKQNNITIRNEEPVPPPILHMDESQIPFSIGKHLMKMDVKILQAIQATGIPIVQGGMDLFGVSFSGSGKTMIYTIPAIEHIKDQPPTGPDDGPTVLIISPSSGTCVDFMDQTRKIWEEHDIQVGAVYGGTDLAYGDKVAYGKEVIIGEPQNLLAFCQHRKIDLSRVTYLVLDDAEELLEMGFEAHIRFIRTQIRPDRQNIILANRTFLGLEKFAIDMCQKPPVQVWING